MKRSNPWVPDPQREAAETAALQRFGLRLLVVLTLVAAAVALAALS